VKMNITKMNKYILSALIFGLGIGTTYAQNENTFYSSMDYTGKKNTITSESIIDWTKQTFTSNVNLDTEKTGINMPSGKKAATNIISTELPVLIKDPLLSLYVNNRQQLGDLVLEDSITLEQLTQIIDDGKRTPGFFPNSSLILKTTHELNLNNIGSLMIKHHYPYKNAKPIEQISSRKYTGIIIDARGKLPVQGEFVNDSVYPCFFPEIWDENMNLIYERNMGEADLQKKQGVVSYNWEDDEAKYQNRIGLDPLHIKARKVYGEYRTDPVISRKDALKILTIPENLELLKDGKIVILLDKDNLIHPVSAPVKSEAYYEAIKEIKQIFIAEEDDDEEVADTWEGLKIIKNLQFIADSAQLLPTELSNLKELAEKLKKLTKSGDYEILVEGHTADVNKPRGQQKLSEERAAAIVDAFVANGLSRKLFTAKGFGGTLPVESNKTKEGRAANRRVVITAKPLQKSSLRSN